MFPFLLGHDGVRYGKGAAGDLRVGSKSALVVDLDVNVFYALRAREEAG